MRTCREKNRYGRIRLLEYCKEFKNKKENKKNFGKIVKDTVDMFVHFQYLLMLSAEERRVLLTPQELQVIV